MKFLEWLQARLGEPTSWLGTAAFFASTGTALVDAGCGGVGAFITKEKSASR